MTEIATVRGKSKPMPARRGYWWRAEEIEELRELHDAGLWPSQIADKLHRTLVSVTRKINELGLTPETRKYRLRYRSVEPAARLAAQHFAVSLEDMQGPRRFYGVTLARHVAMWLAVKNSCGYAHISRYFGRNHTTVAHAERRIEALRAADPNMHALTDRLLASLLENAPAPPPAPVPVPKPPPPPKIETPVSGDPDAIDAAFYGDPGKGRQFLEEQNRRFAEAMRAELEGRS